MSWLAALAGCAGWLRWLAALAGWLRWLAALAALAGCAGWLRWLRWLAAETKVYFLFFDFISTFPGKVEIEYPPKWGSLYFSISWKCSNIMGVIQAKKSIVYIGRRILAPDPSLY